MVDVARLAGVSQSTVSFVLNGLEEMRISEETRRKVLDAVATLGYRPRAAGRPPQVQGRASIGVMFDEIATSPFAAISIEGMHEQASNHDIILEVVMTGGDRDYENAVLRKWQSDQVIGVIYGSILTHSVTPPEALLRQKHLLFNCHDEQDQLPSVVPAERRGGASATQALIDAGYQRIAFIGGEPWMEASVQRFEGYTRAMQNAGLAVDPQYIVEGNFMPSGGRDATLGLLALPAPPDAIFCANDLMAVGCYEALKEQGLKVGEDIAVMGYDDQEIAQHLFPPLSTVLLPHREMGQWAIDWLLGDGQDREQHRMECPLVLRESHRR